MRLPMYKSLFRHVRGGHRQLERGTTSQKTAPEGSRRLEMKKVSIGVVAIFALVVAVTVRSAGQEGKGSHAVSKAMYEQWKKELSNWGRWGKDDELGAINLITPAKRKQAAALVKEGVSVSLALEADEVKSIDNPNPYDHK